MRRLAICADDYGLSSGVNAAIAELVAAARLSALSCLVDAPAFRTGAAQLRELGARADVGLHLNFTDSFGERAPRYPLPRLIARAYARLLDPAAIASEIRRQLDLFEDCCGFAPHHVDGHQHVQQFPVIRDALLAELERRAPAQRPWLRSAVPPAAGIGSLLSADGRKPAILGLLGAGAFARAAAREGFTTNAHLLGVYGFDGSADDYLRRLRGWLAQAQNGDLLMTHPAQNHAPGDPIAAARVREHAVLRGAAFGTALAAQEVVVARLSQLAGRVR